MATDERQPLRGKLPMVLPQRCPICESKVYLTGVDQWGTDDGEIIHAEYDCETEPDIDMPGWDDWHRGHWRYPYIDWLPWETRMLAWLNRHYFYGDEEHETR